MPSSNNDAHLELSIGDAARVARTTHDHVHQAMFTGALPHHRDRDGRRIVRLGDLLVWMRNVQSIPAHAAEQHLIT